MSHRNARLTVHGRKLVVDRHRAAGEAGVETRSSRPHTVPARTAPEVEQQVLAARAEHRQGPHVLGPKLGVPARTVSRILRRHGVPHLRECDPMTGEVIRSSKQTAVRSERQRPGELVHMDVKKIGRIPDGGRLARTRQGSDRGPQAQEDTDRLRLRPLAGR